MTPRFVRFLSRGARLVQVLAAGTPEGSRGELDFASLERLDGLDAPFPVASFAHDDGTFVILKAGRDDFAAQALFPSTRQTMGKLQVAARTSLSLT